MKKKGVFLILFPMLIITSFVVGAKPLKVGDVIGKIYFTDIKTFIDEKPISSVNVGGKTMVAVEDLQYMGYDVKWNETDRTLKVTSDASYNISGKVIIPDGKIAPKGGLTIEIGAFLNPNPDPAQVSRGYGVESVKQIKCVIPEGKSSIDYKISVPYIFEPRYYRQILADGALSEPVKQPDVLPNYVLLFRYSYYLGKYKVEHGAFRDGYLNMSTGDQTDVDYTFTNIDLK